jgi:hypothetical protein
LGLYHGQVKTYLETFKAEQVRIFLFEELQSDLPGLLRKTYAFLGVDDNFWPVSLDKQTASRLPRLRWVHLFPSQIGLKDGVVRIMPPRITDALSRFYYSRRVSQLPQSERTALTGIFEDDIRKLGSLIERDLSSWLPSGSEVF